VSAHHLQVEVVGQRRGPYVGQFQIGGGRRRRAGLERLQRVLGGLFDRDGLGLRVLLEVDAVDLAQCLQRGADGLVIQQPERVRAARGAEARQGNRDPTQAGASGSV
jgi:hypothetical protein